MCVVGSGFCDELITRSEQLCRVCGCPILCVIQTLTIRRPRPYLKYYSTERNVTHLNCCKFELRRLSCYSRIKICIVYNDTCRLCYTSVGLHKGCNSVTGSGLHSRGIIVCAYFRNSSFSTVRSETEYGVSPPLRV